MSYENKHYQDAVKYIETNYRFADPTVKPGYNTDDFTSKSDKTICLQCNTIIAMLTQIQNKIDNIQHQIFEMDRTGKGQEFEINKLSESLLRMNLGPNEPTTQITSRKAKINFLMYKKLDQI